MKSKLFNRTNDLSGREKQLTKVNINQTEFANLLKFCLFVTTKFLSKHLKFLFLKMI
jgi:hypothetical protein